MSVVPPSFEDKGFKEAVARAWPKETAPVDLRARVTRSLAQQPRQRHANWRLYPVAIAAGVLLLVTLAVVFMRGGSTSAGALPVQLADDMVMRHEWCTALDDHHNFPADRADFPQMRTQFESRLGHSVLVARLPGDWTFQGSAICPVGRLRAAHLVFLARGKSVSMFSLASDSVRAGDFSTTRGNTVIAGFAQTGRVYALVGDSKDGSLKVADLEQMRDVLRPQLAMRSPVPQFASVAAADAELMFDAPNCPLLGASRTIGRP